MTRQRKTHMERRLTAADPRAGLRAHIRRQVLEQQAAQRTLDDREAERLHAVASADTGDHEDAREFDLWVTR